MEFIVVSSGSLREALSLGTYSRLCWSYKKRACGFFVIFFSGSTVEHNEESAEGDWVKKTKLAQKICMHPCQEVHFV